MPTPFDATQDAGGYYVEGAAITEGQLPVDDAKWAGGGCADGLLPAWVINEQWYKNTYYAIDEGCTLNVDCLSINGPAGARDRHFVLVFSGRHGLGAHTNNPADYYDAENTNGDEFFDVVAGSDDYVMGVSP